MSPTPLSFYLPENPDYTIVQSALDSVRFLRRVSETDKDGFLVCRSVDASHDGSLKRYRNRLIEGVGYCADSIFGAHFLVRLGRILERPELETMGWSYADHAIRAGFFEGGSVPIRLYRDSETGELLDNLEGRSDYVELGHIARVAHQLLCLAKLDGDANRREVILKVVKKTAEWVSSVERCENGWYPRRATPRQKVFRLEPDAFGPVNLGDELPNDPIYDCSGAGTFVIQLLAKTTLEGIHDATQVLRSDVETFMGDGGYFGSTNTDTEDAAENVSYAMAFQALSEANQVLHDDSILGFAYSNCLEPLEMFELVEDFNGLDTKGLLFMEKSWNSACMWEIAEAAQSYLVAYKDRRRRKDVTKALTMLRGVAKHHHGPHGFLTEAVDWDGHSVVNRHIDHARYADINVTHPFLNNLHILEPTVTFLESFAQRLPDPEERVEAYYDFEGNRLCSVPASKVEWMAS